MSASRSLQPVDLSAQSAQVAVGFTVGTANRHVVSWTSTLFAHFRAVEALTSVVETEGFSISFLLELLVAERASVWIGVPVATANRHVFVRASAAFISWQTVVE